MQDEAARGFRWPRLLEGGGGLLLAVCFLLPMVRACDTSIAPVEEVDAGYRDVGEAIRDGRVDREVLGKAGWSTAVALPHLWGLLALLGVLALSVAGARTARALRRAAGVLLTFWQLVLAILLGDLILPGSEESGMTASYLVLSLLVFLLCVPWAIRARAPYWTDERLFHRGVCVAALLALLWLGYVLAEFALPEQMLYGLPLAVAAALLMGLGARLEEISPRSGPAPARSAAP